MKGFKKCSNGHFYKEDLAQCPYCQGKGNSLGNVPVNSDGGNDNRTIPIGFEDDSDDGKTQQVGVSKPINKIAAKKPIAPISNKTHFEEEYEEESDSGKVVVKKEQRSNRRLVGWLVTYSIDPLGIDYKIYEGRNVIGHDVDCNITVNDKIMSGKHAVILFRADDYVIQDQLSANGTFVNDEDIKYTPTELQDGDIIKMGKTVFKFRSSL
jgi:hypothetical protein